MPDSTLEEMPRPHAVAATTAAPNGPEKRHRDRMPLGERLVLGVLAAGMLVLYGPIAFGTLKDCWHDENYSHGVLVPLVVLALLWQRQKDIVRLGGRSASRMRPVAWLLLLGGGASFVLGCAAAEWFTLRASGVLVVLGLTGVLGGPERLRRYGPPLALLACAVPLPYVLYYKLSFPLQLLSAKLAAGSLHLFGFSVARTGNIFEVNGHALEVVGACSGVRSMMTLCTLALVAAVGGRLGVVRGAILAVAALPVALFGNLLRLVVTALLVAWLGPRGAEGTLHDAVGFGCFLVAAFLLFGLVGVVRRPRLQPVSTTASSRRAGIRALPRPAELAAWLRVSRLASPRAAVVALVLLAVAGSYGSFLRAHAAQPRETPKLASLPFEIGSLQGADVPLDDRILDKLRPEDYIFRSYETEASPPVGLYVAYYRDPREGAQIHSPLHCYPGAGWRVLRSEPLHVVDLRGAPTRMQRLLVAKRERQDVVVYWYDTRTGRLTSDLDLKLNLMRTALLHRPQDAAFVRWSTPIAAGETVETATTRLMSTVARAYPGIAAALPFAS